MLTAEATGDTEIVQTLIRLLLIEQNGSALSLLSLLAHFCFSV